MSTSFMLPEPVRSLLSRKLEDMMGHDANEEHE